jgi:hypothetical protein
VLEEELRTTYSQHRVDLFTGYVELLQPFINRHADVACFLSFTATRDRAQPQSGRNSLGGEPKTEAHVFTKPLNVVGSPAVVEEAVM